MSDKPKRPFLKKGTRQFLSNAQVRSQNDKPKIVDFGQEEEQGFAPIKTVPVRNSFEERPIATKKQSDKATPVRQSKAPAVQQPASRRNMNFDEPNDPAKKIEEFRRRAQENEDEDRVFVSKKKPVESKPTPPKPYSRPAATKIAEQNSYAQEREPEEEGNLDFYLNKKKKPNGTAQKPVQQQLVTKEPHFGGGRKKYEFDDEPEPVEEQLNFDDEYGREVPDDRQYPEYSLSPDEQEPEEEDDRPYKKQGSSSKKKVQKSSSSSQQEQYNFDDQQEWGNQPKKGIMKRSLLKQQLKEERGRLEEDLAFEKKRSNPGGDYESGEEPNTEVSPLTAPQQKSKLVDKFFYKQENDRNGRPPSGQPSSFRKQDNIVQPTKITADIVPEDVKMQIIEEGVMKMKQILEKEVEHVKAEGDNLRRLKIKYEQEVRQLEKDRKELERQTERRKLQFEQYMKEEKAKIAKDKKVIKDGLENRYTRKEKQQFEQMRKEIEDLKEEKRKAEGKLRTEVERQKKLVAEEQAKNKNLEQEIKQLEKGRIRERQQLIEAQAQPKPTSVVKAPQQPQYSENINTVNTFSDPLTTRMLQPTFTLSEFPLDSYRFEANAYYQRYCDYRDQPDPLESEKEEPTRIKRTYRSGKLEHEYIKKYIKEIFPDGYEIIHFVNGDVKQKLPNGVLIYFVKNTQLVEYTIPTTKCVYYFMREGQVEMRNTTSAGQANEIYNGVGLTRKYPDRVEEQIGGTTTHTKGSVRVVSNDRSNQVSYPKNFRGF